MGFSLLSSRRASLTPPAHEQAPHAKLAPPTYRTRRINVTGLPLVRLDEPIDQRAVSWSPRRTARCVPVTVFGYKLEDAVDEYEVCQVLESIGLNYLADTWVLSIADRRGGRTHVCHVRRCA
jgi:hypothetical protein